MTILYKWDSKGYYSGSIEIDPKGEMPPQTTTKAPPALLIGQYAVWRNINWAVTTAAPSEPSVEELRAQVQQAATAKRWEVMTGGLALPGGIEVGTTIDDQNRITSVVANAALAGLTDEDEVDFKATSGWVRITIGQVKTIAGAIGQFVQACYSAERAHHEAIELLDTIQAVRDYDVDDGWPDPVIETEAT